MPLSERLEYDQITILADNQIWLREARVILDNDGSEITRTFRRQVLEPGQVVSALPARVRQICGLLWTPQVVSDYARLKEEREARSRAVGGIR